jgi:hypothetical protein
LVPQCFQGIQLSSGDGVPSLSAQNASNITIIGVDVADSAQRILMSTFFSRSWKGFWVSHVTLLANEPFPSGSAGMLISCNLGCNTPNATFFYQQSHPKILYAGVGHA